MPKGATKSTKVTTVTKTQQETVEAPKGLTTEEYAEVKEAFQIFDSDGSGEIDVKELKEALENLGLDADNKAFQNLLDGIDQNGDGTIQLEEFVDMMTAKPSPKRTREELLAMFKLISEDGESITLDDLHRVEEEMKDNKTDEVLEEMIYRADTNKDGKVSFEEFYCIMIGAL